MLLSGYFFFNNKKFYLLAFLRHDIRIPLRLLPERHMGNTLVSQQTNKVLHDVFALLDAFRVLLDCNLFCRSLESEKVLDVELGRLFEAGPVWVLWVDAVHAVLVNLDTVLEALVPGLDAQRARAKILK